MPLISITDPHDPAIAAYQQIRERDLVGRQGLFIAEGEVVLRCLSRATTMQTLSVLIDQKRVAGLGEILGAFPAETPVYAASQAVMDQIAGFPMHRGILALGRRPMVPSVASLLAGLPDRATVLVLCGIANHDNMGGLFRNAAAFGVDAVLLDPDCCDPLYRKAIRVSVGAALLVPFAQFARGEDVVSGLEAAGFQTLALSPAGETRLAAVRRSGRMAILLGAEGEGLSAAVLSRSQTVTIPMAKGSMATAFDSLNVATTAGIVLHHLLQVAPD